MTYMNFLMILVSGRCHLQLEQKETPQNIKSTQSHISVNILSIDAFLWAAFVILTIATILTDQFFWMYGWYFLLLKALGVGSVMISFLILRQETRRNIISITAIIIGIVVGQWWFLELVVVRSIWYLNGMAP